MTDREMLELAALAADINRVWYSWEMAGEWGLVADDPDGGIWNPLLNDGDALRLAVKLSMDVLQRCVGGRRVEALCPGGPLIKEPISDDPLAATRRAIVRAAAEIGRAMKEQQP